ncbi:MAG: response regulator [Kofleriaceae bacterium]|nr:response regulator [Kofleriaceae bacterium]
MLGTSLGLQLVAAVLALRLVRKTASTWAWVLIAVGLVLMSSRRAVTLVELVAGDRVRVDLTAELIALTISMMMVTGVALIGPVFERLRDAEQLVRSRERDVRHMLEGSPDGLLLVRDGRCVFANPTARRLLGIDAAAATAGRALVDALPAAAHDELAGGPLAPDAAPGRAVELCLGAPERPTTVELVAGPEVAYQGEAARLLVVRDLTERKAIEAQLLQAQKLEALGQMAGGIAHDFNNLLTVIVASAELARRALPAGHAAGADLDDLGEAADRGAALTRQLLAFSRHGTGRREVLDLAEIVDAMQALLRALAGSQVEVVFDTATSAARRRVRADRSQVEQVVVNLVINARDAMPGGGQVRVATRAARLQRDDTRPWRDAADGDYAVLVVSDDGVGMAPEVQARIFDPFFTTKPPGRGTGLGLATCYAIAGRLGGGLTVATAPGRGSTFELWLPAADDVVEAAPAPVAPAPDAAPVPPPGAILLVEDEPVVRALAARLLRTAGHEVVEAADAAAALAVLEGRHDFALLLTDVVMPGMSGVALAAEVGRRYPEMARLLMSGYAEGLPGHADIELVAKPYSAEVLLARVAAALAQRGGAAATATASV